MGASTWVFALAAAMAVNGMTAETADGAADGNRSTGLGMGIGSGVNMGMGAPRDWLRGTHTVSSTGSAVVDVVPDQLLVTVGVETRGATYESAKQANEAVRLKMCRAVENLGVGAKPPLSDLASVEIERSPGDHSVSGYTIRGTHIVLLKSLRLYEPLVAAALRVEGCRILGYELRATDMRKYTDEARAQAVRTACENASVLAAVQNCKLVIPGTIRERPLVHLGKTNVWWGWRDTSSSASPQIPGKAQVQAAKEPPSTAPAAVSQSDEAALASDAPSATLPGHLGIRAEVMIEFEVQKYPQNK